MTKCHRIKDVVGILATLAAAIGIAVAGFYLSYQTDACSGDSAQWTTPECLIRQDDHVDIIIINNTAYKRVGTVSADAHTVDQQGIGQQLGAIQRTSVREHFSDWDATMLPRGTRIFTYLPLPLSLCAEVDGHYYLYSAVIVG